MLATTSESPATAAARLLVVDDERSMRELLAIVLKRDGHEVLVADTGRTAIDLLRRERIDILITDIRMPEMNGVDLLREAKRIDPEIVSIVMTAFASTDPAVEALRAGMDLRRFDLDNNFVGFGHEARVEWPDGADLRLVGPAPLDCFVLYCPAAKDVFVIEAVSNCTDWPNLRDRFGAAQTGGATLAPGAMLEAVTRFLPTRP
jgi:CheY-like chemotaxis protein